MGKSIGIVSLKGGVGKTFTVISLGSALAEFGQRVLLVDANFSAPNLGINLNILDPEVTLVDVLNRGANMKDAIYCFGDSFHVVPTHLFKRGKINPFDLKKKLGNVKKSYDVIILDSSPALNEETMAAMLASDEIFAVTTPDYATLATTIKAVQDAKRRGTPVNGLILNRVRNKNFELSVEDIEDSAGVPVLAVIPDDIHVLKAQSKFIPSVLHKPKSKGSIEFKKLAAAMLGADYKPFSIRDIFKFTPKKHEINREVYYRRVFG